RLQGDWSSDVCSSDLHKLGADSKKDDLVYEEKDERFDVGVGKSRSGRYIFLSLTSHTTSEFRYLDAGNPTGEWKTIAAREQDIRSEERRAGRPRRPRC